MATHASALTPQEDPTQVDAGHYSIEAEDEHVRILRARYGPHEKSHMHAHPALTVVMLTDAHIRMTYPDGRSEVIEAKAGEVMNMPATVHQPENLSDERFEAVLVERKG
jgi:beta-alanine degradation protein BauB